MRKKTVKSELRQALEGSRNNLGLQDLLKKMEHQKIVIYGAGYCGRFMLDFLTKHGLKPEYFLDANAKEGAKVDGIPVYLPDRQLIAQNSVKNAIVLLCVMAPNNVLKDIADKISGLGYETILSCGDIYFSFMRIFDSDSTILDYDYYKRNETAILDCVDLFADDLSLETYKNNILAYLARRLENTQPALQEAQYFPEDIPWAREYARFVDCGAFNGDTIGELLRLKPMPQAVFAFEPDLANFTKLSDYVNANGLQNTVLFPCGVSGKTELLGFRMKNNTQSSISSEGDTAIQCVALDDVLKNVAPTFIKMDIEGAEYDALLGARKLITNYIPDLAICVYHNFEHYFRIPLLLNSWNVGYKFYLRTYDKCGTETVLYATCER